jgi:hypothetical protein
LVALGRKWAGKNINLKHPPLIVFGENWQNSSPLAFWPKAKLGLEAQKSRTHQAVACSGLTY